MPLEQSVFTDSEVGALLVAHYGIAALSIKKIGGGTANCRHILTDKGELFLKEYQKSGFDSQSIEHEAGILELLCNSGFPTVKLLKTLTGKSFISANDRFISLQPFVSGTVYTDNNDLPDPCLIQAAGLLGRMHAIMKDYPIERGMDGGWVSEFCPDNAARKYDSLLAAAKSVNPLKCRDRIERNLHFKKELLYKIAPFGEYFKHLTYTPTHGDYSARQLICCGEEIKAVIDFSSAACLPAAWELMRCYTQSATECADGRSLDTDKLCRFVGEYLKYSSLSGHDLLYMPHIYLFQLGRSAYGYREYLLSDSEDRENLLRFAHWRTNVCRMMLERADEIGRALNNCFREHQKPLLID